MPGANPDFQGLFVALNRHGVDYIVVGGVAAAAHGAPVTTFDLDIVHSRTRDNVSRLLAALTALEAVYRESPSRRLRPTAAGLAGPGRHLLVTKAGYLDVLGALTKERVYEDLLPGTTEIVLPQDLRVRVLDLPMLITLKEELGGEKDRAVLPVLRQTLRLRGGK